MWNDCLCGGQGATEIQNQLPEVAESGQNDGNGTTGYNHQKRGREWSKSLPKLVVVGQGAEGGRKFLEFLSADMQVENCKLFSNRNSLEHSKSATVFQHDPEYSRIKDSPKG